MNNKLFDLTNRIALVTGANRGLGFKLAEALAGAGATICFNATTEASVAEGIKAYEAVGINARGYACNVTDEDSVNKMVKDIEQAIGTIDILVNNAGIIKRAPMCDMSVEDFRQVVDVDLTACFITSKAVIPRMIKKGHGKIINMCSIISEVGRDSVSAYAAAKGGLKMLTKNIASEYGQYNIQCNGIGPGFMATAFTASLQDPDNPFNSFLIARTPASRWGNPTDLQGPVVFLASDASDFVNGHILYVDGGTLASYGKPDVK